MAEQFRRGQMVPKRLGFVDVHRDARHLVQFGCDVTVDGRTVRPVVPGDGPVFMLYGASRRRGNGTRQRVETEVHDVALHDVGECFRIASVSKQGALVVKDCVGVMAAEGVA